ncbi:hypothetical protein [Streptomyces sp. BPTC-684]|uniref:hypothetical protein n=1 Tax=Streptomyces sp. BPTC-684 TaxID=3043734 RepID=UPI0024B0A1C8|nr:hypothetical protein [Streptomyces sp. BPTC-684]WHM37434.1 hypothetical protein QIY60_11310 [Streptomyces sp. BPTC-684]
MRFARSLVLIPAAAACLIATTSWASSGSGHDSHDAAQPSLGVTEQSTDADVARIASSRMPALPIETYLPKAGEDARIAKASAEFVQDCMARFGFQYQPPAISQKALDSQENGANRGRRYGISDLAGAGRDGYHLPASVAPRAAVAAGRKPMSEAENRVFIGDQDPALGVRAGAAFAGQKIPSGGCAGEAQRKLKVEARQQIAEKINNTSFVRSQENPLVKAAFTRWSACMARSGYTYKTPLDPLDTIQGSSPSRAEITVAQTDVRCKDSSNLVGTWFTVESRMQRQLIAQNSKALAADSKSFGELVRRASLQLSTVH